MSFRFANGDGGRGNGDALSALLSQAMASRNTGTMEPPPQRGVARALSSRSVGGDDSTASLSSLAGLNGNALEGLSDGQRGAVLRALTNGNTNAATTTTAAPPNRTHDVLRLLAAQAGNGALLGAAAAPPAPQPPAPSNSRSSLEALLMLRANQAVAVLPGNDATAAAPQPPAPSNSSSALETLLRLRANQTSSTLPGASAQSAGLGGAAAAQAGLFCRPAAAAPAPTDNTANLELEILRMRAGLLQSTPSGSAPRMNNDLLEQALQFRANQQHQQQQPATDAGRRLSMLMQGSSGRSLGSAMGSGRAIGSGRVAMESSSSAASILVAARRSMSGVERSMSGVERTSSSSNVATANQDIAALVRSANPQDLANLVRGLGNRAQQPPAPAAPPANDARKLAMLETLAKPKIMQLPPVEEGNTPHHSQRVVIPLGIEEDPNWLSERQCFIRSELLEVVRASHEEVLVRSSSKSIAYQQVGIRCRYCAHMQPGSRAIRASAFPSSIRQMYQSFTMMVRDHFGNCTGVPQEKKQKFLKLKGLTSPSSSLSRQYWTFAAKKLGMVDSEYGIMINEDSQAAAAQIPPFGTSVEETAAIKAANVELLVDDSDRNCISPYLFFLMQQAQTVDLLPSERVGKRKDAAVGLPGFGCRHCAETGRLGFCRMFPLNKRSLPDKVNDLYNHMVRCPQCPRMTKRLLESRQHEAENDRSFAERDRDFIDRIWIKLGRDVDPAFKKS